MSKAALNQSVLHDSKTRGRCERNRQASMRFREQHDLHEGYLICFRGQVIMWALDLPEPSGFMPGCFAFSDEGSEFTAIDGNDLQGAKLWECMS